MDDPELHLKERPTRSALAVFIALAVLAGPARSFTSSAIEYAMHFQQFTAEALSATLAGVVLLLLGVARCEAKLHRRHSIALLALLLPQWIGATLSAPLIQSIPWLHETPWGVTFLLTLAAPLWLGLLAALELVSVDVPRAVVGAGIAAIGAAYLVIPTEGTTVAANQLLMLALHLLLNIAVVYTWAFAVPRLDGAGTFAVAGWFLVLSGAGAAGFSLLLERTQWQAVSLHELYRPLLAEAGVVGSSCWLWFWLLERMTLAAFSMNTLAAWTAALMPGFMLLGFLEWRADAALAIALAAIVVALRARTVEEQPLALGLSDS